jgi:hypothetical protein
MLMFSICFAQELRENSFVKTIQLPRALGQKSQGRDDTNEAHPLYRGSL